MIFPYLENATFERRTRLSPGSLELSQDEWDTALEEAITEESSYVRGVAQDNGFDPTRFDTIDSLHSTFPEIRKAVIRLTRDNMMGSLKDGLTDESTGSGASGSGGQYTYQSSMTIHAEVAEELREVDWQRGLPDVPEPDPETGGSDVIRKI